MNQTMKTLKIIALATVLSFGLSFVYAWTAPTVTPPGGNTAAPINTSATAQVKNGGLSVNALTVFGNAYIDGRLGVGTTTPSRKLHIVTNNSSNDGNQSQILMENIAAGGNAQIAAQVVDTSARAGIQFRVGPALSTVDRAEMNYNFANPGFEFWTMTGGWSPKVFIKSSGNVGIGTAAPTQKLDVAGTARMTGFQLGTSATAGNVLTTNASGVGTWQAAAVGGGAGTITVRTATNAVAKCLSTEVVTGGGGTCASPGLTFAAGIYLHNSFPSGNGWGAHCGSPTDGGNIVTTVYAMCMQK